MFSRRKFLGTSIATGVLAAESIQSEPAAARALPPSAKSSFVDLLRPPDVVRAYSGLANRIALESHGNEFSAKDVCVGIRIDAANLQVFLNPSKVPLTHLHLRWLASIDSGLICLGDQWERNYGDLAWRGIVPERVMPWYFATSDGTCIHAYGVKTGASALCFWQLDPEGISLWMDVSNGGAGVLLRERQLELATIVSRRGEADKRPLAALQSFCQQMSPSPRSLKGAIYGVNDWYYAYGNNSQKMLLQMTDLVAEVAPSNGPRPYAVVDDGWKDGSENFPSMAGFASEVKVKGARPGIWIRPLKPLPNASPNLLLPSERFGTRKARYNEAALDPTIPYALQIVIDKFKQVAGWGFELVKHDYSTYDLLGQWGFEMGATPTNPGWHFHDRARTNAEIIRDFYRSLRAAAGDGVSILGCNTIGHLGAGIFELQRTGDDTSGKERERTRRMGVNTLAHRLPQHGTFFQIDADCVAITKDVPWEFTRQWLDVVARSKTALFISPDIASIGPEQRSALRESFSILVSDLSGAEPLDPFHETTPEAWISGSVRKQYSWCGREGASPFGL